MNPTVLTSEAKEALRKMVRGLRTQLVKELSDEAEGRYELSLDIEKARLRKPARIRRERLEEWIGEQLRATGQAQSGGKGKAKPKTDSTTRLRYLRQAVQEAAHTLLHRLVLLRILEHHGVVKPAVVTGGYNSAAYKEFADYSGPLGNDLTRGMQPLLDTVFAELSLELPALFGPVGLTGLFPIPPATLRDLVTALNDPALDSAWGDDTTLGWVYQYWNDSDREALDKKIADGGKIEPHEIASKTQMFTERYMVEWLLQNSLGLSWLTICKKNGWRADAEDVLPLLDERRAAFRKRREAGEVDLEALMPIAEGVESAWKYYVPQAIPAGAVEQARSSVRELKLLDPACGSGHFLVIAFDLLARIYEEEARHRGVQWSREDIAESILGENLHGIDIDARAIQIAAAALWLKAKLYAPEAKLGRMNLVAPALRLAHLPSDDPVLETLRGDLEREVGIPRPVTTELVKALAGVDYLGTLLRVDRAAEDALKAVEGDYEKKKGWQGDLYQSFKPEPSRVPLDQAKITVLEKLETFLARHSASEDLGVRLDGEQLAAGARFLRIAKEATYDVVVGNPPYHTIGKLANADYYVRAYPAGRGDLFAGFFLRAGELARPSGLCAFIALSNWMFLGSFKELRTELRDQDVALIADLGKAAFTSGGTLISTACLIFRHGEKGPDTVSVALQPHSPAEVVRDDGQPARTAAALLLQRGRYEFDPKGFAVIEGEPIVYWWTKEFLDRYAKAPKLGDVAPVRLGVRTSDNVRFLRTPTELPFSQWERYRTSLPEPAHERWVPYVKGAEGREWLEPLNCVVEWRSNGLELKLKLELAYGMSTQSPEFYFLPGIAFSMIGAGFRSRAHRFRSIIGDKGSSAFPIDIGDALCVMNSRTSRSVVESLNPSVSFQVGDVVRIPVWPIVGHAEILSFLELAFDANERAREGSVEFRVPGSSPWRAAQSWAQWAVDRSDNLPLPPWEPNGEPPAPEAHASFAVGVALGRFGANGEGILDKAPTDALPAGILFVGPGEDIPDSLDTPPAARIADAWEEHQLAILDGKRSTLRDWLRKDFFAYHKGIYENRPIYFSLSTAKKSFVAWVSIHRWSDRTLQTLLADHVNPVLRKLDAQLADVQVSQASSDKKTARAAEERRAKLKPLRDELADFAEMVSAIAERGAPPTDSSCPARAADAPFVMDLDDGVMINSAALWPLLAPQWADPKKWWKQLCLAEGKKHYDWAHLARRYFPARVEEKCKKDPSLAVAHGCFWKYHPAKAYAWELRLKHEIRPDFTIDEQGCDASRASYVSSNAAEARAAAEKEDVRWARAQARLEADDAEGSQQGDDGVESDEAEGA